MHENKNNAVFNLDFCPSRRFITNICNDLTMLCVFTHLTVNRVINFKRGCKRQVDNSPTGTVRFISKTITALAAIYRHFEDSH